MQVETALWRNANPHWDPVVASFLKYFKSRILAIAGGSPPAPPAAPRGSGLSARRLSKISRDSNSNLIAILTSGYVEDVISFEKEEEKKWDIKYF